MAEATIASPALPAPFEASDHVILSCHGGPLNLFHYDHHAIVMSVGYDEISCAWKMCVSDFTIDGSGDPNNTAGSGSGIGVSRRIRSDDETVALLGAEDNLVIDLTIDDDDDDDDENKNNVAKETEDSFVAKEEDYFDPTKKDTTDNPTKKRRKKIHHGLRVLCVTCDGWRKVHYNNNNNEDAAVTNNSPTIVRRRVEFLLSHPNIIPPYSLIESNCECVAVWCKTGKWTTLQFANIVGVTNMTARFTVAGLSLAMAAETVLAAVLVPGAPLLLGAGVVTEVVTGVWGDHARRMWEERTKLLNVEFEISQLQRHIISDDLECSTFRKDDNQDDEKSIELTNTSHYLQHLGGTLESLFAERVGLIDEVNSQPKELYNDTKKSNMKMMKVGMPKENVEKALERDGNDVRVADMDSGKSSQPKKLCVDDMDPEESYANLGMPAWEWHGKDVSVADMKREKSYANQVKVDSGKVDADPPLKDDPEYSRYFRMLRMGLPLGAVMNAMQKDGKDPNIINLNPDKSVSSQQQPNTKETQTTPKQSKGPKIVRKRLHWNKIDDSKRLENSFWNQAKDHQLVGLDVDNEEFTSLFTASPMENSSVTPNATPDQKVQLIDSRRRMNGSILLKKFKVNYRELARQVDQMEVIAAEANELRGMMQLLPTKVEASALRNYLPPVDAPQSAIDESIAKLGECEQYMTVMLDIENVENKFQAMVFRAEFDSIVDSIRDGTKILMQACGSVKNSERFRKLLLYALKLGNALNTDGSTQEATAITLDSLLKLAEAKAFDRQTSVLSYLVSILQKNDEDVLRFVEDFVSVKSAERVSMDMIAMQLRDMEKGVQSVMHVTKRHLIQTQVDRSTDMGQFSLKAESTIQSLIIEVAEVEKQFAELLQFFGEDSTVTPEQFFSTINNIVSVFDHTNKN